jgi:hypothetical protein
MARKPRSAATTVGDDAAVDDKTIYRIRVEMSPHETVRNLGEFRMDYCCMPQERDERSGKKRLHAYARGATIAALRKAGRKVEVLADAIAEGRRMQKLISKTDRFEGGKRGPEAIGKLI